MMHDVMLDKEFLKALDHMHLREVYVKIISLTMSEEPVAEITGSVTSGSVNIDGKSSVRRTCNISLTTNKKYSQSDVDWALRTKFQLYIGLKNMINDDYDDIIYFKMGIFLLTSYSVTLNEQGYSISLQGKDKMSMLNGDISGTVTAENDFGSLWEQIANTNRYQKTDIPIKTIIREAVHEYGLEPYGNIIINDLDTCGVELIAYRARNNPIYVYNIHMGDQTITQMCFENSDVGAKFKEGVSTTGISIYSSDGVYRGDGLTIIDPETQIQYTILKRADYGQTIGFKATDLTYAGDLIVAVGETITSMLDKIVTMLGDFEYFYDLDGHFVFQRKKIYYNTSWSNAKVSTEDNGYNGSEIYYDSTAYTSMDTYVFEGGQLIESYNNSPNLSAIKNDYSIWGAMKGVSKELPIHLRCAIDIKPTAYFSEFWRWCKNHKPWYNKWCEEHSRPDSQKYTNQPIKWFSTELNGQYDWRQLIFRMAKDCFDARGIITDISADLNNPSYVWPAEAREKAVQYQTEITLIYNKLLLNGYARYYTDLLGFWEQLYRVERQPYVKYQYDSSGNLKMDNGIALEDSKTTFSEKEWALWQANGYWNPDYFRYSYVTHEVEIYNPDGLIFWFDFLDPNAAGIRNYAISKIGHRPKVVNDTTVKSIFVRDTPDVLFINPEEDIVKYSNDLKYARMTIPTVYANYFSMSSQGKSAKEVLDQLIYEGTYYNDTINLSAMPVYYLEPNTRIKVYDETTGIDGDYLIDSLSYSLAHDGLMSVKATRAEQRIL